ncbi:hypothetical protein SteCoe_706 [Stentor coeruleus]|uniref:chitin synthase n=1 Tax=Stentor coeruleus TaxID=5963 RepID=A0A1R2D3I7_9CILI|nr:hypothetical protein SteCoe_706 [Stentor coeruleus]
MSDSESFGSSGSDSFANNSNSGIGNTSALKNSMNISNLSKSHKSPHQIYSPVSSNSGSDDQKKKKIKHKKTKSHDSNTDKTAPITNGHGFDNNLKAFSSKPTNGDATVNYADKTKTLNPDDMPINEILPPCQFAKYKNCDQCNKKIIDLQTFRERVSYQAFKLQPTRDEGIVPLGSTKENEVDIECDFLRNWIKKKQECKFLIVVAMYNENCEELYETLNGCLDNLHYFFRVADKTITPEEIGIVFIVDGIEPFLKTFLRMEGSRLNKKCCFRKNFIYFSQFFNLDVIKEEFMTKKVLEKDPKYDFKLMKDLQDVGSITEGQEISHLFCQKIRYSDNYYLNTIFCVKQLNKRKLNTHRWFFEGFCSRIDPKYVTLLDVGTKPKKHGLYYLYDAMERDNRVAGCCGEIVPQCNSWNPIVNAQVVEYKFSHIMDKGLESIIGYVSVLPGAFSAYRWDRLNDNNTLDSYFYSQRGGPPLDLFKANMYLAEDRILCLELMCQVGRYNILRYVKWSVAETDVPSTLNELMAQRRRWVNGSWFSMIYTIKNCNRIGDSNHSWIRKCLFKMLMVYYSVVALFNWVLVGAFYLAFCVALRRNLDEGSVKQDLLTKWSTPVIFLYTAVLACILITSFAVKPRRIESLYRAIMYLLGIYTYFTIFLTVYFIFKNEKFSLSDVSSWGNQLSALLIIVGAAMFTVIILLNLNSAMKPVLKGVLSFIFLTGTYVNLFMIYAICNIHDCSWGNRPDKQTDDEKKMVFEYKNERTRWVIVWIFSNAAFAYFLNIISSNGKPASQAFINILALVAYFIISIKFIGGLFYVFDEWCCCCLHEKGEKVRKLED